MDYFVHLCHSLFPPKPRFFTKTKSRNSFESLNPSLVSFFLIAIPSIDATRSLLSEGKDYSGMRANEMVDFHLRTMAYRCREDSTDDDSDDPSFNGDEEEDDISEDFSDFTDSDKENEDIFDIGIQPNSVREVNRFLYGVIGEKGTNNSIIPVDMEESIEAESDYADSDEMGSVDESDDEGRRRERFPEFNATVDFKSKIVLKKGIIFDSFKTFRNALKQFCLENGFDIHYIRNETKRITAICKEKCGWRIHASPTQDNTAFQIKSFNPQHQCGRIYDNSLATAKWIAETYLEFWRDSPNWNINGLLGALRRDHSIEISRWKAYRAKEIAKKIILGQEGEQYEKLISYCLAIKDSNRGSNLYVRSPSGYFETCYVCMSTCKEGFLRACRPIISVDGCFLKGKYGGQLLCAVGRDANDNMFPIAWAVVRTEDTATWRWFLDTLLEDIGSIEEHGWVFISDRQKGLNHIFEIDMQEVDHRYCLRHLYNNMRNALKTTKTVKDIVWNAARAYTEVQFERHMTQLKEVHKEAYQWMSKIPNRLWCKHKQDPRVKCDSLLNNMAETFNAYIKEARDKPVLTMLEIIRRTIMKRLYAKREGMQQYKGHLPPRIQNKLEKIKGASNSCIAYFGGSRSFEVVHFWGGQNVVDLDKRTCSCRQWDHTGIPCQHAVAAILKDGRRPEDFVDNIYSVKTYLMAYEKNILPVPGEQYWPQMTNCNLVLPPLIKKRVGRPKKVRKREEGETINPYKTTRKGLQVTCSKCRQFGHNQRTCKSEIDVRAPNGIQASQANS